MKEPFQNFPAAADLESVDDDEEGNELDSFLPSSPAGDGQVALACVSCRQENTFLGQIPMI